MNYYIVNGELRSQNELQHHSGRINNNIGYIDLPADVLVHWKYIKREKVNGKWRYWYNLGQDEKAAAQKAQQKADAAKADYENAKLGEDLAYRQSRMQHEKVRDAFGRAMDSTLSNDSQSSKDLAKLEWKKEEQRSKAKRQAAYKSTEKREEAESAYKSAQKAADDALKAYENSPLGKIDKFSKKFKNGMKKVSKVFKKLFGRN